MERFGNLVLAVFALAVAVERFSKAIRGF